MTTQIVLLRAVNVVGSGVVAMSALRQLLSDLDFCDVRTVLQSGNVVLRCGPIRAAKLEAMIELELERRLGLRAAVMARSARQWKQIVAGNPFIEEAKSDPSHLLVMVAKQKPASEKIAALQALAATRGPEIVRACDGQVYVTFPAGVGRSKLTSALIEKTLGTSVTARNWNTVLKLAELAVAAAQNSKID